jgi:TRAP-type C4-dicarboxylate transport system substrate-binding protein
VKNHDSGLVRGQQNVYLNERLRICPEQYPMRTLRLPGLVLLLLACVTGLPARAELVLMHPGTAGSLYELSAQEFARRVNSRLPADQQIKIEAVPVEGDGSNLLTAVRQQKATLVLASSAMLDVGRHFAIFELPYLIRGREQVRAIRPALLDAYLQPAARKQGIHILGIWENGFRHMSNNLRPVTKPQDLSRVGIALAGNGWRERVFDAFGADSIPTTTGEIESFIQERRAEGREGPLNELAASVSSSLQPHLTLSDHLYSPAFLIAESKSLEALPAAVQEALASEAVAMEGWIQKTAIAMENELVDQLDGRIAVTHADIKAFQAASWRLYALFMRIVPEGMEMIQALQKANAVTAIHAPKE